MAPIRLGNDTSCDPLSKSIPISDLEVDLYLEHLTGTMAGHCRIASIREENTAIIAAEIQKHARTQH